MRFLCVVNWSGPNGYQHYRNRRAPWIKAYTSPIELPLEHPSFTNLSDGAKLTLHHVRLLAGVTANQIPEGALTRDRLNMKTPPRISEIIDAGFAIWFDASEIDSDDASIEDSAEASGSLCAPGRARSQASPAFDSSSVRKESKAKPSTHVGARGLIESFELTDKHRAWAAEKVPGIDIETATDAWRDHFRATGYRTRAGPVSDADGAWRNWMRNELKFSRERNGNGNGRSDHRGTGTSSVPPQSATTRQRFPARTGADFEREIAEAAARRDGITTSTGAQPASARQRILRAMPDPTPDGQKGAV